MLYESKDGSAQFDAYRVEAVQFTGEAFSGAPFSGAGEVDWMHEEIKAGMVSLVSGPDAAHATWAVNVGGGEAVLASPGDYVVKQVGSKTLYVCMGDLWELLTRPVAQVHELSQAEVDAKAEAVAVEHRKEFDPSEWNERVGGLLKQPATAWQVNWQQLFDEVKDAIGEEVEVVSLPHRTFYLYGVLSNMVTQAPDVDDRYFRNVELWQEVIRDSCAMGEKFVARVMEHRLPAGDVGDVICVPVVADLAPQLSAKDILAVKVID